MKPYQLLLILLFISLGANAQISKIYVATSGSDGNDGSMAKPFATINKAMSAVRAIKQNGLHNDVNVIFRGGIYQVDKTLNFTTADGGDATHSITYMSYPGEKATISGGRKLTSQWQKESTHIWKYNIGVPTSDQTVFRSLYADDKRLVRGHSIIFYTVGQLPPFKHSFKMGMYDSKNIAHLKTDSIEAFCGFTYNGNDLRNISGDPSAELLLYGSWEASWHKIYKVDSVKNNTILLKTPARYPVGYFNVRTRYRIENEKQFLRTPGNWCYDEKSGYIYYYSAPNEDPNAKSFYIPVLSKLIVIRGTKGAPVTNLKFTGLDFKYTNSEWAVNATTPAVQASNKTTYPWLDFSTGFTSGQGAFASGQAILELYTQKCIFQYCDFAFLDNYAVRVGEYSDNNSILNCNIYDCGSGGIILGFDDTDPIGKNKAPDISPSYNTVANCTIYNCGLLHPSGIGIAVLQASHNLISSNKIYNLAYTGISTGWTFDKRANYTSYNTIQYNTIHDVMRELTDGGGVYTLGVQVGTVFKGNYIYNITRSPDAIGSRTNAFFFDQGSSGFKLDSNVVVSVSDREVRYNQSDSTKILMGKNYFERSRKDISTAAKMLKSKLN
jgi:hypothetical protein